MPLAAKNQKKKKIKNCIRQTAQKISKKKIKNCIRQTAQKISSFAFAVLDRQFYISKTKLATNEPIFIIQRQR